MSTLLCPVPRRPPHRLSRLLASFLTVLLPLLDSRLFLLLLPTPQRLHRLPHRLMLLRVLVLLRLLRRSMRVVLRLEEGADVREGVLGFLVLGEADEVL
jgi:hypothetical protein